MIMSDLWFTTTFKNKIKKYQIHLFLFLVFCYKYNGSSWEIPFIFSLVSTLVLDLSPFLHVCVVEIHANRLQ
jgi:hypothetical protein